MARILIIDDDPPIRALLRQILERAGHEVIEAANGKLGLQLLTRWEVQLVITDILMPERDGIEVILELKNRPTDLKIIAISGGGRGMETDLNLRIALDMGVDRTLAKPFTATEVLAAVTAVLEG